MLDRGFLRPILDDDSLTRGLGDEEARLLVEWLEDRAECLAAVKLPESMRVVRLQKICRHARTIGRFVRLWCYERDYGAAVQLAGAENVPWPLPCGPREPCELMQGLVTAEELWLSYAAA